VSISFTCLTPSGQRQKKIELNQSVAKLAQPLLHWMQSPFWRHHPRSNPMSFKSVLAMSALALAAAVTPVAQASTTFQGMTFTFIQTDADTLSFNIQGTPSGDWLGVNFLGAFDLKNLGINFGAVTQQNPGGGGTGTANGPGATNLAGINTQISANNCNAALGGSPDQSICFDIAPDQPVGSLPLNFTYTIDFNRPLSIGSTGVHLQIVWTSVVGGAKVGSLYSQDVGLGSSSSSSSSSSGTPPGSATPEPGTATLALLGLGLIASGLVGRRRKTSV
jgi:PEP-CTERM motif